MMTTTITTESPLRRWLKLSVSPGIFLLLASYFCIQAGFEETWPGKMVTNFTVATWMFFLFSWALPLITIVVASYQLIRCRSLQHAVEIGFAIWLLIKALGLIVKAN
jgi:hypothetical protein